MLMKIQWNSIQITKYYFLDGVTFLSSHPNLNYMHDGN